MGSNILTTIDGLCHGCIHGNSRMSDPGAAMVTALVPERHIARIDFDDLGQRRWLVVDQPYLPPITSFGIPHRLAAGNPSS